jgi:hypothetical protein
MNPVRVCDGKAYCRECKLFLGLMKEDGTGPYLDGCMVRRIDCTTVAFLSKFEPAKARGYDIGTNTGPVDSDAGSYQSIAMRALEDA